MALVLSLLSCMLGFNVCVKAGREIPAQIPGTGIFKEMTTVTRGRSTRENGF